MKRCINLSKDLNGFVFRCNQPVKTKVDKSIPSIRVVVPPQSNSDNEKRFIHLYPERVEVGNLCDFHQSQKEEKRRVDAIDRKRKKEVNL